MGQGDFGKDLPERLRPGLHELAGVLRAHGEQPDVEEQLHDRVPRDFVLHEQDAPPGAHHPLHFPERFPPGFPLQLVKGVGAGDGVEGVVREGERRRVPLDEAHRAGAVFLPRLLQHPAGKIQPDRPASREAPPEGLADGDKLSPVQQQFVDKAAIQCGFCTPGMVITSTALLMENPDPDEDFVKDYLRGNYCRCTGYVAIVSAVLAAAEQMKEEKK